MTEKINKTIDLRVIKIEKNKYNKEKIDKISFIAEDLKISWKPKIKKQTMNLGFVEETEELITIQELPEVVRNIATEIQKNGYCMVEAGFLCFDTNDSRTNEPITYYFINSAKLFEDWKIKNIEPQAKKVEETKLY